MKAKEVLKILNISRITLYNYVKQGKIRVIKTYNGRYEYNDEDVWKLANKNINKRMNVIYARVSSHSQKKDLENQVEKLEEFCTKNGVKIDKVYKDIGNGIDFEKRKEFLKLFDDITQYKVNTVYITYKDRLSRIGFRFLEKIFNKFGTNIVVINESKYDDEKLAEKEIFKELISIIHSYSIRIYSNRRKKLKLQYCEEELKVAEKNK